MSRFINPIPQYILANGDVAAGGSLAFYESGTNTLITLYADVNENIPIANPVTLGSRGEVPNIFFSASARCVLTDANGYQIYDVDPVNSDQAQGAFEIWNSNLVYGQSDIVFGGNGEAYISLVNENQGNDPTLDAGENAFWARVLLPQVYNSQVSYQPNELAIEDGVIYRSLISNNTGNQPSLDNGTQWKSIANGIYVDYDNTSSGLVAVTAQAALDEIVSLINNLPSSVIYRGQLDVSAGDSALPATPQNGDLYVIAVAGTITVSTAGGAPNPVAVNVGEQIIYNGDTGNWDLIAQVTQASSVSYNNTASGLNATDVQTAIDEVESRVDATENATTANASDIDALEGRATSLEAFEAQAGTAYTADVQTNQLDTSAGALMAVGAFGLGDTNDLPTWPQTSLNNLTGVGAGIYRAIFGTSDTPDGSNFWVIWYSGFRVASSIQATQIALRTDGTGVMYFRGSSGGTAANPTWSPWRNVWHDGNLVKTTSSTDTTAGRMLKVGDFGLGRSITYGSTDDTENLLKEPHFWDWDTSSNAPSNVPNASAHSGLRAGSAGRFIDIIGQTQGGAVIDGGLRWRQFDNAYGDWKEIWDSSNLTKTTSATDNTTGRVVVTNSGQGWFGIGASDVPAWPNRSASAADLDNCTGTATGVYGGFESSVSAADGWPISSTGVNYVLRVDYESQGSTSRIVQELTFIRGSGFVAPETYKRTAYGGSLANPTWSPWKKVLNVGDFGLGNEGVLLTNANDLNDLSTSGFYYYNQVTGLPANIPVGVNFAVLTSEVGLTTGRAQTLTNRETGAIYKRALVNGAWLPWIKLWHDGNLPLTVNNGKVALPAGSSITAQGTEGGELLLQIGSESTLAGDVVIDQQANNLRIFENGGVARGARIRIDKQSSNASSVIYTTGDPNVKTYEFFDTSYTQNREAPISEFHRNGSLNRTLTLGAGWQVGDVVKLRKVRTAGQWTINAGNNIFYPDGSIDTSLTIPDGVSMGADLYFNGATFYVTVLG